MIRVKMYPNSGGLRPWDGNEGAHPFIPGLYSGPDDGITDTQTDGPQG